VPANPASRCGVGQRPRGRLLDGRGSRSCRTASGRCTDS
jgi:hypothetical protein